MQHWRPATAENVRQIVKENLETCDAQQLAAFEKYGVEPHTAQIVRYGKLESVLIVARKGDEVIYWEDVEEGFNVSPAAPDGRILEHWCNQDELGSALDSWIEGRERPARFQPPLRPE